MKAYRISGTAPFGSQRQPFSYDVTAEDNDALANPQGVNVYSPFWALADLYSPEPEILGSSGCCDGASRLRATLNEIDR